MEVFYPVRPGDTNGELKYSLRSLTNFRHDRVFICGYKPKWVTNVEYVENKQESKDKYLNGYGNLKAFLERQDLEDEILMMNDDFYILKPVEILPIYRGREVTYSMWKNARDDTLRSLKGLRCLTSYSYEQHTPLLVERDKLKFIIKHIENYSVSPQRVFWRTVYGNYFSLSSETNGDVKKREPSPLKPDQLFLSSEDTTFDTCVRPFLKKLFPSKCIYEK